MPKYWLQNLLFYAVVLVVALLVGTVPYAVTLSFGLAWGLLAFLAALVVVVFIGSRLDVAGVYVILPGGVALVIGLIAGIAVRLLQ